MNNKQAIAELLAERSPKRIFKLEDVCFDKQLTFINDNAKFKTAVCGRRAGKTYACAAYLLHIALTVPKSTALYITLTRSNAKKILWPTLLELNKAYALEAIINESDLSIHFGNGSRIYLSGANDRGEIEKFRGLGLVLCIIDETQSFKAFIENLVEEIITKALYDFNGTLALIGTPGPVSVGYYFDCAAGNYADKFSHHIWTMFDNPHLKAKSNKTAREILEADLARKGITEYDSTIRREVFAEWTTDTNALVFHYDASRNGFEVTPTLNEYVIGVDIGTDDADAVAVLGWGPDSPKLYLVEEYTKAGQDISELAEVIERFSKFYNPLKIVMDTGGLGKKVAEELNKRFGLGVVAAEKSRKMEYIELLNDALRTQNLYIKSSSLFAHDSYMVKWDFDKSTSDKLVVSNDFHSDICDAVLYAYREALHWLYAPKKVPLNLSKREAWIAHTHALTEEYRDKQIEKEEQEAKEADYWGTMGLEEGEVMSYFINKKKGNK